MFDMKLTTGVFNLKVEKKKGKNNLRIIHTLNLEWNLFKSSVLSSLAKRKIMSTISTTPLEIIWMTCLKSKKAIKVHAAKWDSLNC